MHPWRIAIQVCGTVIKSPTSRPSWFPESEIEEEAKARPDASGNRVLIGRLCWAGGVLIV